MTAYEPSLTSDSDENQLDTLAILAYKIAPRIFDVSTNLNNISIRDQIIRSRQLVFDLIASKSLLPGETLLIIGASVAGLSCGLVAASKGIKTVILEKKDEPLNRFKGVTNRLVGPYMYEWPACFSKIQKFPIVGSENVMESWFMNSDETLLRFDTSNPISPQSLRKKWIKQLDGLSPKIGNNLSIYVDVIATFVISGYLSEWREKAKTPTAVLELETVGNLWVKLGEKTLNQTVKCSPRQIILAAGFADEIITNPMGSKSATPNFWGNDKLLRHQAGSPTPPHIVVVGGGDGALQDCLRAITREKNLLVTIAKIRATAPPKFDEIELKILAIEHQHQLSLTWARNKNFSLKLLEILDNAYRELAKEILDQPKVREKIYAEMRPDIKSVTLCLARSHIEKAYSLNRFLIHLFNEAHLKDGKKRKNHFRVIFGCGKSDSYKWNGSKKFFVEKGGKKHPEKIEVDCDIFVERIGLNKPPASQLLGIENFDLLNRVHLSKIPQPFSPAYE